MTAVAEREAETLVGIDPLKKYRPSQVAAIYGVCTATLVDHCRTGTVRASRTPGHHWRILGAVVIDDFKRARNYRPLSGGGPAAATRRAKADKAALAKELATTRTE